MLKLGWFSTARGETSRKLLTAVQEAILASDLDASISVVFCDRDRGEDPNTDTFLELVDSYHIPLVCFSYQRYRRERNLPSAQKGDPLPAWRSDYDSEIIRRLAGHEFQVVVLAGYMLVASDVLCTRYDLLNLHPAAPGGPKGIWQEVIWQLIEERAPASGVTMHLATPDLDRGPVVTYCRYSLRGQALDALWEGLAGKSAREMREAEGEEHALFNEIRRHGVARELPLVVEAVRALAGGQIILRQKQVLDASGRTLEGYDLTASIERVVAASGAKHAKNG